MTDASFSIVRAIFSARHMYTEAKFRWLKGSDLGFEMARTSSILQTSGLHSHLPASINVQYQRWPLL